MTTQIKFRGFRTDGKGWVEGLPNQYQGTLRICREIIEHPSHSDPAGTWIYQEHEIHRESLGQFTGQTDKNGKEIYGAIGEKGGDVVRYRSALFAKEGGVVKSESKIVDGVVAYLGGRLFIIPNQSIYQDHALLRHAEIIGNQFEQDNGN